MSKGFRLRAVFSVLAIATASLALAGTAGASPGGGVVIQARDACDPVTFPAGLCNREPGNSGERVTFDELLAVVGKKHSHPAWRFSEDNVTVRRGASVVAQFGRGGEVHTFSKVTDFGPGCVDILNQLVFGKPDLAPVCSEIDPVAGVPKVFIDDGLFPGRTISVDTSRPGTQLFECLIHPWMRTAVTVR
jgi:hypothetical protein